MVFNDNPALRTGVRPLGPQYRLSVARHRGRLGLVPYWCSSRKPAYQFILSGRHGIKTPKDLEGKRLGALPTDGAHGLGAGTSQEPPRVDITMRWLEYQAIFLSMTRRQILSPAKRIDPVDVLIRGEADAIVRIFRTRNV
jgi:hypothetical protein